MKCYYRTSTSVSLKTFSGEYKVRLSSPKVCYCGILNINVNDLSRFALRKRWVYS